MKIELSWSKADHPPRIASIDVKVKMPEELPQRMRKPILKVAHQCFIHQTIQEHPKITINLS